jgi:hypothetical protein
VSGAVALLFEQNDQLTQALVTETLQAAARKPKGKVPYGSQIGAGALDVEYALEVLGKEPDQGTPPSMDKSFYYLSSESARPDPSWEISGTIQLRREDGSIASGLDGSLLRVEVDGGQLVRPATKLLHGTFDFAVAGRRGTGGEKMTVRVTYAGEQVGEVATLPIAIDEWAADGPPVANGGLDCTASGRSSRNGPGAFVLVAFAGLALARRRALR